MIYVDMKKKEILGDFKDKDRILRQKGFPEKVRVHDFKSDEPGKSVPHGAGNQVQSTSWVNVGIDHDTTAFAIESVHRWWNMMGNQVYPKARQLLITADSRGSNGSRSRFGEAELQKLGKESGLEILVSYLPPVTYKWNKIAHWIFSHLSQQWEDKPLVSYEVTVNLIASPPPNQD